MLCIKYIRFRIIINPLKLKPNLTFKSTLINHIIKRVNIIYLIKKKF